MMAEIELVGQWSTEDVEALEKLLGIKKMDVTAMLNRCAKDPKTRGTEVPCCFAQEMLMKKPTWRIRYYNVPCEPCATNKYPCAWVDHATEAGKH